MQDGTHLNVILSHQITPILGFVGIILLAFTCPNPTRGAAEMRRERPEEKSSYLEDVKYLLKK